MTIVRVDRESIARAIETEPIATLGPGAWVQGWSARDTVASPDCRVCAVGATMRNAVLRGDQPAIVISWASADATSDGDFVGDAEEEIAEGHYMAALSAFFETAHYDAADGTEPNASESIRARTAAFVRDRFPDHVEIDIGDAVPAPGIEVVR